MGSNGKRGPLIVEPASQVRFPGPPIRPSRATIKLINNTTNRIAFKIKTTAPSFYGVRPNTGVVLPRNTAEVEIARQPFTQDQIAKINHKFMVQSFVVPDDATDVSKLWSTIEPGKLGIQKLRCVFEGAPTSSVEQIVKPQQSDQDAKPPKHLIQETHKVHMEAAEQPQPSPSVPKPKHNWTAQMTQTSWDVPPPTPRDSFAMRAQEMQRPQPLADHLAQRSESMESIRRMLVTTTNGNGNGNGKENKPKYVDQAQQMSTMAVMDQYSAVSQPVDKNNQWSYHSQNSTSIASKNPLSPKLSPVRLPSPPKMPKQMLTIVKAELQPQKTRESSRKQQKLKNDDIFTALQLATMNTEIHHLRSENKHLRNENTCLKQEAQNRSKHQQQQVPLQQFHSPVRREYTIPHVQLPLPQQEAMVPMCYIVASMTFALLCLIIGKFVL